MECKFILLVKVKYKLRINRSGGYQWRKYSLVVSKQWSPTILKTQSKAVLVFE